MDWGSYARLAAATLALASAGGCAGDDDDCNVVFEGSSYRASYAELSGTCGPYEIASLQFSSNLAALIMILPDGRRVTSEAVARGCSAHITQLITREHRVLEKLDGVSLQLEPDGSAHGQVELQRFDEQGQVTCTSTYDAQLTRVAD